MKKVTAEGIRQRSEGSFEIDFRVSGHRFQKTIKADSIKEAKTARAKLIAETLDQKESPSQDGLTFEAVWIILERNLIADGLPHKTQVNLKKAYQHLFTDFRLKRFPNITKLSQLNLPFFLEFKSYYIVDLDRPRGLRGIVSRVKMIMHRLRKLRLIPENLMEDLKEFKTPARKKKAYPEITATDIKKLLQAIKIDRPDIYGPVYFMLRTGRRIEETLLIERNDVAWDGLNIPRIHIRAETTKMDRPAPLNYLDDDLQAHVRLYYQRSNNHKSLYLFLNKQHKKFNQNSIRTYLGDLSQDLLKVRITSHYFRHRFCTETCKARLPLVDIQAISGIKNISILIQDYCHSSVEGQASVLERTRL